MRYLARFDRTAMQVERFLLTKGASSSQAKRIVSRLSALGYVDDHTYVTRWVENRLSRQPMGRERIKAELVERGLPDALVDAAIRHAFRDVDEETLARKALRLRRRDGRRLLPRQALYLLRRRGFEEETIERIMEDRTEVEGRNS